MRTIRSERGSEEILPEAPVKDSGGGRVARVAVLMKDDGTEPMAGSSDFESAFFLITLQGVRLPLLSGEQQ